MSVGDLVEFEGSKLGVVLEEGTRDGYDFLTGEGYTVTLVSVLHEGEVWSLEADELELVDEAR